MKKARFIVAIVGAIVLMCEAGIAAAAEHQQPPAQQEAQKQIAPKRVEVDSNFDGKVDRVDTYNAAGEIDKVEVDINNDGIMDETVIYESGKPKKSIKDTNSDGKPDIWVEY